MADTVTRLREATVERALTGSGKTRSDQRRAAFANAGVTGAAQPLVATIAAHAYKVTDENVTAAARASSEDAVFELAICAALGEATRQLDSALAALDLATATGADR